MDINKLAERLMKDIKVELQDEFDKNFERKAFFEQTWTPRTAYTTRGSLLLVTGNLRRSISAKIDGHSIVFSSSVVYASVHNEGLKAGRGEGFTMPKRQFIGTAPAVKDAIKRVVDANAERIDKVVGDMLRKGAKKK